MGCITSRPSGLSRASPHAETEAEKLAHVRRKSQHLIQNLVHEEYRLKVDEVYDINGGKILGTGISGMVRVVRHHATNATYAMKTLHLNRLKSRAHLDDLRTEVQIMSELDHPNIVKLYETFETEDHIFLIMELCTGGELLDMLHHQEGHHYSEPVAVNLVKKMVGAIRYCHDHHIAHRDLKLENFLFESTAPDAELKLIDFGLSRHYRDNVKMHRPVGTPYYVAPEVLEGAYTQECDMWSIGVITYMLLSGRPPFFGRDDSETLMRVREGKFDFPASVFDRVSASAKDFIRRLLTHNPSERLPAQQAPDHPWLHEWDTQPPCLSPNLITSLQCYHGFSPFKKVALEVVAFTLRPEQLREIRTEFEKVDVNSNGAITVEALRQALQATEQLSESELKLLMSAVDTDHQGGLISWHEFVAATLDTSFLDDEHLHVAFERIDTSHCGYITREDLAELVGVDMSAEQVNAMFNEFDVAQEGKLEYEQFADMMRGLPPRVHDSKHKSAGSSSARRISLRPSSTTSNSSRPTSSGDSSSTTKAAPPSLPVPASDALTPQR